MNMSEHDRSTIVNGLRVAAERFSEHVTELTNSGNQGLNRLAEQFERQRVESLELAQRIENES